MPCAYCTSRDHTLGSCKNIITKIKDAYDSLIHIVYDYDQPIDNTKNIISPLNKNVLKRLVAALGGIMSQSIEKLEEFCYNKMKDFRDNFYNDTYLDKFRIEVMLDPNILHYDKNFYKKNECAICLGGSSDICYLKTSCGHSFCNCIIQNMIKNGVKCPLCRQNIHALRYTNAQFYNNRKVKKLIETCDDIYFTNLKQRQIQKEGTVFVLG